MKYQDQKLQAIGRLTLISFVLTVLLALVLIYPEPTVDIVRQLRFSRNGGEYVVLVGVLGTLAFLCWGVLIGLILTSPEQEVRFVRWTKRWRKAPIPFEAIQFDTDDANYQKTAWRYFMDRRSR